MRRRGTTLIELIVTITVLTIVAAGLFPRIVTSINSSRANEYRGKVLSLLRRAREEAITSGTPKQVVYSEGEFSLRDADSETNLATVAPSDMVSANDFLVDDQEVGEGDWAAEFYPDGTADSALFSLEDAGATQTIRVMARSGRLQVRVGGPDENPSDNNRWEAGETVLGG